MKLAFYKSANGDTLDSLIDLWSGRYGYSHVELVFDRISTDTSKGNLCFSSSPREGKCRFKNIHLTNKHWCVIDISCSKIEEEQFYGKCFQFVNSKYDYYGIFFWYLFPLKKENPKKWWCSEIVSYVLNHKKYHVTPNYLAKFYDVPKSEFKLILNKTWRMK